MAVRLLVSVVDDDESVRGALPDLLWQFGFDTQAFASAAEFLGSDVIDQTTCLILDISMPGMTGPELHRELLLRNKNIPVVFITANEHQGVRQRLIEQGAVDCLFKPFSETILVEALNTAMRLN